MPELPEVETIVGDLNKKIRGYQIISFWTDWKKTIKIPLTEFQKGILGKRIEKIKRRAKNILFFLSNGKVILVHLKMTGHLLIKNQKSKIKNQFFAERVNQYIHHIWFLKKGHSQLSLEFSDLRKFGKIELFDKKELADHRELSKLGLEPLEKSFGLEDFKKILKKKPNWSIRDLLLDQRFIVGIGNIYVSEILFDAGIDPRKKVSSLIEKEKRKIYISMIKILAKAIELRGTSDSDYRDTFGAPGGFQKVLKVYGRTGEKCLRKNCKGVIIREKLKQRSSFRCPICQK